MVYKPWMDACNAIFIYLFIYLLFIYWVIILCNYLKKYLIT